MTKWICHPEDHKDNPLVPVFRRRIKLRQKVKKAVLKLSAHGLYLTIEATNPEHVQHGIKEIRIDGEKVDLKNGPLLTESFLNGRSKACVQVTMGI